MRRRVQIAVAIFLTAAAVLVRAETSTAHAPSGAIFTTVADGSEVNFNRYASKPDVYLDGGPGLGAPQTAAGLDDGLYHYQVTNPSGKVLLSQDAVACRQFRVTGGVITAETGIAGCQHATGTDIDHNAVTVQLMPFADTPNRGGEYKVWVTFAGELDCNAPGNKHCFVPGHSKTDNFKVGGLIREIDVLFFPDRDGDGLQQWDEYSMSGYQTTWIDTLGASNKKWSYRAPELLVWDNAHIEMVEPGTHKIVLTDQPGCRIGTVRLDYGGPDSKSAGTYEGTGAGTYNVKIANWNKDWGAFVGVACS